MTTTHRTIDIKRMDNKSSQGGLQKEYIEEVRPYLDLIDKLREFNIESEFPLPKVVVVGDQSSGKSSLLENLSSVQLPKGSGMVTKCPLIMRMKTTTAEYFEISYMNNETSVVKKIDSKQDICREIILAQDDITKNEKKVVNVPITLKLHSPESPDLTLIDLPGLIHLAVKGQDDSLPDQVEELVEHYMQDEDTIILFVICANVDAAVNKSKRLANKVDPEGKRTLGVITKCDLLQYDSEKKEIMELFNGNVMKDSTHEFAMVSCRHYNDRKQELSVKDSIELEKLFFQTDPIFKSADSRRVSIGSLSQTLTKNLVALIKAKLPHIHQQITENRMIIENELGSQILWGNDEQFLCYLQSLFENFISELAQNVINGDNEENNFNEWRKFFSEIHSEFTNIRKEIIENKLTPDYFTEQINHRRGKSLDPNFIDYSIFREPLEKELENFEVHAVSCLEKIFGQVRVITDKLINKIFSDMQDCIPLIKEICHECLVKEKLATVDKLKYHLDLEKEIFTQDITLNREREKFQKKNPKLTENKQLENNARNICELADCYLKIVVCRLSDQLPLCILFNFNRQFVEKFSNRMRMLMRDESFVEKSKNNPKIKRIADLRQRKTNLENGEKELKKYSY